MLVIPRSFELAVPASRAVSILDDRIARGEELLAVRWTNGITPEYRRRVDRWQAENEAIVSSLLRANEESADMPSAEGGGVESEEGAFEALKDDVSRDVNRLSQVVVRIRLDADMPLDMSVEEQARAAPATSVDPAAPEAMPPLPDAVSGPDDLAAPDLANAQEPGPEPTAEPTAEPSPEPPPDEPPPDEPPPATPIEYAIDATAALPAYDADAVAHTDLIGVDRVVDAFSYLVAARTMQPPLAIGLFGQWGSGKTFLMRAVQRRVDQITRGARESGREQSEIGVYKRVVQIEFNAWHYVEGNLWASLVDHIFSNLRTSEKEDADDLSRRRLAITKKLASTQEEHQALNERIDGLQERRGLRQARVTELQEKQRKQMQDVQRLRARDIAAAVTLKDADTPELRAALSRVGVTQVHSSAVDAAQSLASARDVVVRGSAVLGPMRQYGWRWALLLALVLAVAPLTSWLIQSSDITEVLASISAFLGVAAAVAASGTRWAAASLTRIEAAEARVRQRVDSASDAQAQQIAALQQGIDVVDRELADARRDRDAVDSEIDELNAKLADLTPGRLLADFLEQRMSSSDYRKHLGLTAIVRRDFEQLSRLVADNNEALLKSAPTETGADFNRVVLYVDDLDRCPPRRVVEVLQAVHLLMSFAVFVVVVAVDPRWLSQSLQVRYRDVLGTGDQATPDDYLEKIFQIPFRVAPLDLTARARFVEGLLDSELAPAVLAPPDGAPFPSGAVEPVEGLETILPEDTPDRDPPPPEVADQEQASAPVIDLPIALPRDAVDLNPASLRFTNAEARFLERLLPLLDDSPRSIKRYINIYRLIKSVGDVEGTTGDDPHPAPFEAAMLLLAMQTGLPTLGPRLVERAAGASDPSMTLSGAIDADADGAIDAARLREWLRAEPEPADWPLSKLGAYARHVRLYAFG